MSGRITVTGVMSGNFTVTGVMSGNITVTGVMSGNITFIFNYPTICKTKMNEMLPTADMTSM
jgi:hypothetical protein